MKCFNAKIIQNIIRHIILIVFVIISVHILTLFVYVLWYHKPDQVNLDTVQQLFTIEIQSYWKFSFHKNKYSRQLLTLVKC